jgi:hypothetical protein
MLLLLTVVALMVAMMAATAASSFAQPGGSENSCGASNPNIGFPPAVFNKGEEFVPGACGFRNNPNYEPGEFPPGQFH